MQGSSQEPWDHDLSQNQESEVVVFFLNNDPPFGFLIFFLTFEGQSLSGGGEEREGDSESEADSRL